MWHFSNFTIGHSHLTMYGFVTFAIWGGIYALLPRATHKEPDNLLVGIHFWLATVGIAIYVVALSIGGTIQGLSWVSGAPFIQSVIEMAPFWLWRLIGGTLMFLSHLVFAWNVWTMTYGRARSRAAGGIAEMVPA
ncbi:MAG: cbb3-type cytochrome c oxidase subunit I, partial [Acetobacteraceae bacterium]